MLVALLVGCAPQAVPPDLPVAIEAAPPEAPAEIASSEVASTEAVREVAFFPKETPEFALKRGPPPAARTSYRDCIRTPEGEWVCAHPVTTGFRRGSSSGPRPGVGWHPHRHWTAPRRPIQDPTAIVEPWGIDTRVVTDTSVVPDTTIVATTRVVEDWDPLANPFSGAVHTRTCTRRPEAAPNELASLDQSIATDPRSMVATTPSSGLVMLGPDGTWTRSSVSTHPTTSMSSVPVAHGSTVVIAGTPRPAQTGIGAVHSGTIGGSVGGTVGGVVQSGVIPQSHAVAVPVVAR